MESWMIREARGRTLQILSALCHVLIRISVWFLKGCFETHHLVLLGHVLAVAGYFPPVLITRIFNVSFLSKLDAQLEGRYLAL